MFAIATGMGFSLAGFNEVLTCISLVLGIGLGSVSLFRLLTKKTK